MPQEFDSPWKEAFRLYLRSFLRLCFAAVERAIDWSRGPVFLDKELQQAVRTAREVAWATFMEGFFDNELQQIVRDADSGTRFADLLVKVWLLDGSEEWILLHIEVQHRADPDFASRLFRYHYRILDVHGKRVVTLAILADADPDWRPAHHETETLGTRVRFDFSVCKLLDLVRDEEKLKASREPSAVIVLANWAVQQAGRDDERRLALKWDLVRRLYGTGLAKAEILELFRLIDWLVMLPADLEARFRRQLDEFEQEQLMPYVTSVERLAAQEGMEKGMETGIEKGMEKGQLLARRENIIDSLETRFGTIPPRVKEIVNAQTDVAILRQWHRLAISCQALEDFKIS